MQGDAIWEKELEEAMRTMVTGVMIASCVVIIFSLGVLGGFESVHSRKIMLLACICCIIFAVIGAVGMTSYIGQKWNTMLPVSFNFYRVFTGFGSAL